MDRLKEPIQLLPVFHERVWGREDLRPFFPESPEPPRIGEVWFTSGKNPTSMGVPLGDLLKEHPEILGSAADPARDGICPILVKLLFTSDRLSVQVHPAGKTEAWCILGAQPQANVAVGFRRSLTGDVLRNALEAGNVEQLLDWRDAAPGDFFFVPAGTVHAIGSGLTICEIQQNSDITYRLWDYGRARELHVEQGLKVARLARDEPAPPPVALENWRDELLACEYFRIERLQLHTAFEIKAGVPHYMLLVCVKGSGTIGAHYAVPGTAWLIPAGANPVHVDAPQSVWILTYNAERASHSLRAEIDNF